MSALVVAGGILVFLIGCCLALETFITLQIISSCRSDDSRSIFCSAVLFLCSNWVLCFLVVVAFCISFGTGSDLEREMNGDLFTVFAHTVGFLFVTQNYLLLVAMYVRMLNLFESGPLRLTLRQRRAFTIWLIVIPIICLAIPVSQGLEAEPYVYQILIACVLLCVALLLLVLLTFFIVKLKLRF